MWCTLTSFLAVSGRSRPVLKGPDSGQQGKGSQGLPGISVRDEGNCQVGERNLPRFQPVLGVMREGVGGRRRGASLGDR